MPKIDLAKVPAHKLAAYPQKFAAVIAGREKQRLGDVVGLTQFGVNITRIKPGSASALRHWHEQEDELIYMLEGELVLCEDGGETVLRAGDAAGSRPAAATATASSTAAAAMRSISKWARARQASACTIPMSICAWNATAAAGASSPARATRSAIEYASCGGGFETHPFKSRFSFVGARHCLALFSHSLLPEAGRRNASPLRSRTAEVLEIRPYGTLVTRRQMRATGVGARRSSSTGQ